LQMEGTHKKLIIQAFLEPYFGVNPKIYSYTYINIWVHEI